MTTRLRTDDAARAVPYPILALEDKKLPVRWTATEWGVAIVAHVVGAVASFGLLWLVFADPMVAGISAPVAGALLAVLAHHQVAPHLDVDRPTSYLRRLAMRECRMWWWTRGPIDRVAIAIVAAAGWLGVCVGVIILPGWLSTIVETTLIGYAALLVVKRFEPAHRRQTRQSQHVRRSCTPDRIWASRVEPRELTSELLDNCQVTRHGVWAWFVLGETGWWFGDDDSRRSTVLRSAAAWSRLAGQEFILRVEHRPARAAEWARRLDEDTDHPLPDRPGWSWRRDLELTQRRMLTLSDRLVMLAVRVGGVGADGKPTEKVGEAERQIAERIRNEVGFAARRADPDEVAWLLHRSFIPGSNPPNPGRSMPNLEYLTWETTPLGRDVKVSYRGSEAHVVVLSLTYESAELDLESGKAPWLACLDSIHDDGGPIRDSVSVHVAGEIVGKTEMRKDADNLKKRIDDIVDHHRDAGVSVTPAVVRAQPHAVQILDDVNNGPADRATRAKCVVRLIISAPTADEAKRRAGIVRDHYSDHLGMWFTVQYGAGTILRETIPGEHRTERTTLDKATRSHPGYQRWMPVTYLAAGVPTAAATVGTPGGPYWGYGSTSRKPFLCDLHHPMEKMNRSGVVLLSGEPGSGKSVTIGNAIADGIERGVLCQSFDPSNQLQRLAHSDRYRHVSRVLSLGRARPGTLNPLALVPDPKREWYEDEQEWVDAVANARADRIGLMVDTLLGLFSYSTAQRDGTEDALRIATRRVADSTRNPRHILEALREDNEHRLAQLLEDESDARGRLVFPSDDRVIPSVADEQFVVITLPGLQLPAPATSPSAWTSAERWAVSLLTLSVHYASLRIYEAPSSVRKLLTFDEAYVLHRAERGRAFVTRTNRDSRKVNCAVMEADQHPVGLAEFDNEATVGCVFAFRQTSTKVAARALEQLQIPTGVGYEDVLAGLEDGEALHRDWFGRVGVVQIDLSHRPERMIALDTTPGSEGR